MGSVENERIPREAAVHAGTMPQERDPLVVLESLLRSETRYRRLFESARDGILLLDADSGAITDANPFMSELLGYGRDELGGKELWEIGLFADEAASRAAFRQLQDQSYIRYENLPLQTRLGERRDVEFVSNVYVEGERNVIQCNIRDITLRKGSENALTAENARETRIFESITDAFFGLDREWRFTYINDHAERLLLRTRSELLGRNIWAEFPNTVGTVFEQEYYRAVAEQVAVGFEAFYAPRNLWYEVRAYPSPEGIAVCFRNINVRKQVEKALQQSEERLRLATEGAGIGVWQLLVSTGEITYTPCCYELFGLPLDGSVPITNELIWSMMHPDDLSRTQAALEKSQRELCDFDAEYRMFGMDGQIRWVHSRGKPYLDGAGKLEWLQGVISDITDRKRIEAELAVAANRNELIAETLQRSMLQASPAGRFPGIAVETLYVAALNEAEVGGDFFDAFALARDRVALVVGDVSGKGLIAAGRTAEVKYALRALLHEYPEPGVALARLNDFVCETHRLDNDNRETFIVLALVIVDNATGEATFASAGAEPTLILRRGGAAEPVESSGFPLGIIPETTYPENTVLLEIGDTILMVTDGITEARYAREFLGLEGVAKLAEQEGPAASLMELSQSIYHGALGFAGGALRDDVCLLVARRNITP